MTRRCQSLSVEGMFQSTPPCGGEYSEAAKQLKADMVSIHAPVRGRISRRFIAGESMLFQSTPPCGGECSASRLSRRNSTFQSTPPCGGESAELAAGNSALPFQSTPPCGGE